jgi:hypothetical protein
MLIIRDVREFYLIRDYGPAVTELRLDPGPHTPHPHHHLIFSSNPLFPLKKEKRALVEDKFLSFLKKEAKDLAS